MEAQRRIPKIREASGFNAVISENWGPLDRTPTLVPGTAEAAQAHRERFLAAVDRPGDGVFVIGSGLPSVRNDDNDHAFRASSTFLWFTGMGIDESFLVLTDTSSTLYTQRPAGPGDPDFFGNAAYGELWVGAMTGPADWSAALGIDVRPLSELDDDLTTLGGPFRGLGRIPDALAHRFDIRADADARRVADRLRQTKDAWEIDQMRAAVSATVLGFEQTVGQIATAKTMDRGERWLQGTFDRAARTYGVDVGYATIVAAAGHAAHLHWTRNDGPVRDGDLALLDMGIEMESRYTADVTRTIPVSGTFTDAQRAVYDIVVASQRAGLAVCTPGHRYSDFHFASMQVLAEGLDDLGLLPVSVDEALSADGQHHRRYIVCGVGHHLGLDVHDCSHSPYEDYQDAMLEPGMVHTLEPGLYFHVNDLSVPPEFRGIGVRIEDDLVITADGHENLSADLMPFGTDEIEAWTQARL
ncbi:aminopeptidase P family protein [Corynebacterium variabile]|uniref:Xaa-Pro aminopeptidase n=1 Tax=Corynebacterium variabile TaxID=1727 RepID=A0A4Y4C2L4_9CORY|nr:aminopeptidase P family protein [Corynebacterium variabile]GEC87281.1 Xaa-Pro aminopeptidase [Corynebacterium variabile]